MAERRFICDAMLGGLARWLRAAGYSACFDVHIDDGALVRRALEEERCLLTSDGGVMERYAVTRCLVRSVFIPRGLKPLEQLAHVMDVLQLPLRESRCMECGGRLAEVPLDEVAEHVPEKVKRVCNRFYRCRGCRKVYWRGTHWEDIRRRLARAAGPRRSAGTGPGRTQES
jgi:uncharacterized protein with PIN domain